MSKYFYAVMLLLGMSIMVSCENEGDVGNNGILEGKWWIPIKVEALFNGSVVESASGSIENFNLKAFFENGSCTLVDLEDNTQTLAPYTYSNGILNVGLESLRIVKLTNKEGIIEQTVAEQYSWGINLYDGEINDTFKGVTIFEHNDRYWYIDKNDKAVMCEKIDNKWFDMVRIYFKAQ